jgi:hypothetical protein
MNELTVVDKATEWRRMEVPGFGQRKLADHETGLQHALDEFFG